MTEQRPHRAQARLVEACAARDWDAVRAAVESGASAYRNEVLERLLDAPETPGLVETIEWLGRHHAARGDRLDIFGVGEEVAGVVVLQCAGMSPHLSARKLAAVVALLEGAGLDPATLAAFPTPAGNTLIEERARALPASAGLEGLEALVGLRGGEGALETAEMEALKRARAVHALSTGTALERIDAALAGRETSGEALAKLLCEAIERDGGLTERAFAHLRASAPAALAEALDAKACAREETPMDLVGLVALRGDSTQGMMDDVAALKAVLEVCAAREGSGGEVVFFVALSRVVFGDAPERARARTVAAVLIEARPGLRAWETDEEPYVLELCEGAEVRPEAMEGCARPELERLAGVVLPEGTALARNAWLLRSLVRTTLGRAVLARATARDPALGPAWTRSPVPGEEPVLGAALAACIAAGPEVETGWTREAPAPWGVRDGAGVALTARLAAARHRGLIEAYAEDERPRTTAGDAERERLVAARVELAGDGWEAPARTVTRAAADGATLEVRPHTAVLRKLSWVRVHTTARGRRWALDTFRLRVWTLRTDRVETMRLSDVEMERLARAGGTVDAGKTFDEWVAAEGYLRLAGLRVVHYDAQVAGVAGAPGETLLFDDGALALEHGAWPWAPEPDEAPASPYGRRPAGIGPSMTAAPCLICASASTAVRGRRDAAS